MQLREKYLNASKKEKTKILDEYTKNTGHNRKYTISVLNSPNIWDNCFKTKKPKKKIYDSNIIPHLVRLWEIFDYPCGQRLVACIKDELDRLINFGEINVTNNVANLLKRISSSTIDRLLKNRKKQLQKQHFSTTKPGSLLKAKIPVRLTDWDTSKIGFLEADLVAHCGSSASGDYINTVSLTDISSGWWEGEAVMGKGQNAVFEALKLMRLRTPFVWKGLDSDNGSEFINYHLFNYCNSENLLFTRSRENKKNDNAYVEQKNWTHVRKILGYFRYDSEDELCIINDLFHNDLRLYKNFFHPTMKLSKKVRFGSKVQRKYEMPKTPFKRLLESDQLDIATKKLLSSLYQTLNPAQLKRNIDAKLYDLFQIYQNKRKSKLSSTYRSFPFPYPKFSKKKEVNMVRS